VDECKPLPTALIATPYTPDREMDATMATVMMAMGGATENMPTARP
jgi:hypothetical protein